MTTPARLTNPAIYEVSVLLSLARISARGDISALYLQYADIGEFTNEVQIL